MAAETMAQPDPARAASSSASMMVIGFVVIAAVYAEQMKRQKIERL